ncbi:hypothetical protein [Sulfurimonas sp.]|jgi:hypothetical protein|uniref:hypothetical protein n=1 Tax=Sulfurimonas sp. TaxID=2022749 RepID=UPI002A3610F1|nr:hypothetical protein [Sulfurimonas sp.]MDY0122956.1 hypothetical protein [Sulfurimonas sp.]
MKNFIFFTTDGFTFDPNNKPINNMQILGSEEGEDILEAFKNFKVSHSYLKEYAFKDVTAIECVDDFIRNLEL